MNKYLASAVLLILVVLANIYLIQSGYWFYQDTGWLPKNNQEIAVQFSQQLHIFTNISYYLGYDNQLFGFARILPVIISSTLVFLLGLENAQVGYSIFGGLISFLSFYLFAGIFFKNNSQKFLLSLVYSFNPLVFAEQGVNYFNAVIPLFIYSFYYFFNSERQTRLLFLLVNLFSIYLLISYIRFIQSDLIVIAPYVLYSWIHFKLKFNVKKISLYILSLILVLSPVMLSFISQILDRSNVAFHYGSIFGKVVREYAAYDSFNFFQSVVPPFYGSTIWRICGLIFFAWFMYLVLIFKEKKYNTFFYLNLVLLIFGISLFGLANFFGDDVYLNIINFVPFIINDPRWALYEMIFPFVVLLGIVTQKNTKILYFYTTFFIFLSLVPFFNLWNFELKNFPVSNIPNDYQVYFISPYSGISKPTYYLPYTCWRAEYMDTYDVPTQCYNYAIQYSSILIDNPRLVSGDTYDLSQMLIANPKVNDLRITNNLKHIIVPNDLALSKIPGGPITTSNTIQTISAAKNTLNRNKQLTANKHSNFSEYIYKQSNNYDFYIYSPARIIKSDNIKNLLSNKESIFGKPVFVTSQTPIPTNIQKHIRIDYKIDPLNATQYLLKISNIEHGAPFLLQMNQTFSRHWKVVWITKNEFDNSSCIGGKESFFLSENIRCQYQRNFWNLADIFSLFKSSIQEKNHISGNYLSNLWLVRQEELPVMLRKSDILYAKIIYDKQVWYATSILISAVTTFILLCLSMWQELKFKKDKNT